MSKSEIAIRKKKQLLVEGNDQRNFFEALISHVGCRHVQIQNFGGVNELHDFLPVFVNLPDFGLVESVGIVRDADDNAGAAFRSVQSALRAVALSTPPRAGQRSSGSPSVNVFIFPDGKAPGMLETLLNQSFADDPVSDCISTFFQCVKDLPGQWIQRPDKAHSYAYLATRPDPHVSVGVAAMKGYWNLHHPVFGPLRSFLTEL